MLIFVLAQSSFMPLKTASLCALIGAVKGWVETLRWQVPTYKHVCGLAINGVAMRIHLRSGVEGIKAVALLLAAWPAGLV